jgi:hypothetical protein
VESREVASKRRCAPMFQQIGRQEHGEALTEYWDDETFGQDLIQREPFEVWTLDQVW